MAEGHKKEAVYFIFMSLGLLKFVVQIDFMIRSAPKKKPSKYLPLMLTSVSLHKTGRE
jgi:hypothetical protein